MKSFLGLCLCRESFIDRNPFKMFNRRCRVLVYKGWLWREDQEKSETSRRVVTGERFVNRRNKNLVKKPIKLIEFVLEKWISTCAWRPTFPFLHASPLSFPQRNQQHHYSILLYDGKKTKLDFFRLRFLVSLLMFVS